MKHHIGEDNSQDDENILENAGINEAKTRADAEYPGSKAPDGNANISPAVHRDSKEKEMCISSPSLHCEKEQHPQVKKDSIEPGSIQNCKSIESSENQDSPRVENAELNKAKTSTDSEQTESEAISDKIIPSEAKQHKALEVIDTEAVDASGAVEITNEGPSAVNEQPVRSEPIFVEGEEKIRNELQK